MLLPAALPKITMAAIPSPSLVEQAQKILTAATELQSHLDACGLQQPAFEANGRKDWHDAFNHRDLLQTRSALIDASQIMLNLVTGPTDTLTFLCGPSVIRLEVLRTLDSLGVAQAVPLQGSISIVNLASKLGVDPGLLHRHLKFASLTGMFYEPHHGHVAHTSLSAAMPKLSPYTQMRLSKLFYMGGWESARAMKVWQEHAPPGHCQVPLELADPQHRSMWKILEEDDPDQRGHDKFAAGMEALVAAHSGNSFVQYVHGFNWAALGEGLVVDVGGGNGHIEVGIARDVPEGLKFLIQDLEANQAAALALIKQHNVEDRVQFQVHDFFTPQPADLQPKAYILSRILHDWSDADAIKLLRTLIPAMEQGAKLFVSERILPDRPGELPLHTEQLLRMTDILMFTLHGAQERTESDFAALFQAADPRLRIDVVRHQPTLAFSTMEVVLELET